MIQTVSFPYPTQRKGIGDRTGIKIQYFSIFGIIFTFLQQKIKYLPSCNINIKNRNNFVSH